MGKNGKAAGIPCPIPHGSTSVSEQFKLTQRCGECAALRDNYITQCNVYPGESHTHAITAARLRAKGCKRQQKIHKTINVLIW